MDDQRPHQAFRGQCAAVHMECQTKIAKNLERINPCLHLPTLIAEQAGTRTDDGQEFPSTDRSRQLQSSARQRLSPRRGRKQKETRHECTNASGCGKGRIRDLSG